MTIQLGQGRLRPVAAVALACASLIAATALGSMFLRTSLDAWTTITAPGPAGPADGILLTTGLCGTLLTLWLGLGIMLSALSALPGALGLICRGLARRVAPVAVRKVVAFLLGTTLTAALVPGTALAGIGHGTANGTVVATAQKARVSTAGGGAVAAPDASFRLVSSHPPGHNGVAAHAVLAAPGIPAVLALGAAARVPAVHAPGAAAGVPTVKAPGAARMPTEPATRAVPAARASTDAAPSPGLVTGASSIADAPCTAC